MNVRTLTLVLATILAARPAAGQIVAASGYAVRHLPTPGTVQGGVVRQGDAILVGQGSFGVGGEQVIRIDGSGTTTVATGFNSLGGFALDVGGTLYVTDNGGNLSGAATGDTVFAIPNALTRTTALPALGSEVVPAGSIPFAQDVVVDGADLLVSDGAGPGAGRVVRVSGGTPTNLITGLDYTAGLAIDGTRLLVGNVDGSFVGALFEYTLAGALVAPLATGLSGSYAHDLDNDGNILVTGGFRPDFSSSNVLAIAPGGGITERAWGFSFSSELFHDTARDETLVLDFGVSEIAAICRDQDGDGVCDADDDCPAVSDADQTDTDGDGLGDACDPCTGLAVTKPKVVVSKLGAPAGDEALAFTGRLTPFPASPALDPVTKGARVVVADTTGTLLDVTIPAGAFSPVTETGWKVKDGVFKYVNRHGIQSIVSVRVGPSKKDPAVLVFAVNGKKGSYAVDPAHLPLAATLVLDAAAGQCGDATFPGPVPVPSCLYDPVKAKVKCK